MLSISSAKNTLLSPLFRSPHKQVVGRGGLFFRLRMVRGRLCLFMTAPSQGVVHLEKSLMPNLLMHQGSSFVSRENNLKTDNKSSINVFDSSFIGIVNKNGSKIILTTIIIIMATKYRLIIQLLKSHNILCTLMLKMLKIIIWEDQIFWIKNNF